MRNRLVLALLLATPASSCTFDETAVSSSVELEDCVKTQGYWKNHADQWPVSSLVLGTTTYSKAQLLQILRTPVAGNGLISLAHQLIAAKLNVANGGATTISGAIANADSLIGGLVVPPIGSGYIVPRTASPLVGQLDGYNNTGECAPPAPVCGNGVVEGTEECDDGNTVDTDACSNNCTCPPPAPVCGNGVVEGTEECDDGNTVDTDACANDCTCPPPAPVCGNGIVEGTEQCDDGNTVDTDACANNCTCPPTQ